MPSGPPPAAEADQHAEPCVPLSVVTALMGELSGHLHDHPVQALVAAKLMVESAAPADEAADALRQRGVGALSRAAQQSRDVMWALERRLAVPRLRSEWESVLTDHLARAGGEAGVTVTVTSPGELLPAAAAKRMASAQAAVLDVAAAALLSGGTIDRVGVTVNRDPSDVHAQVSGHDLGDAGAAAALCDLAAQRCEEFLLVVEEQQPPVLFTVRLRVV